MFISYITAAANDTCKEKKRQTLTADDVFSALEELEFQEILPQLKEAFEGEHVVFKPVQISSVLLHTNSAK